MTSLRRRADGEGVPLVSSDGEDVDEDPVADVKVKLGLALHHHACHVGGKEQPLILVAPPRKALSRIQTERGPTIQNALNDFATVSAPRHIMKEN